MPTDDTGVRNGRQKVLLLGRAGDAHGPLCARLLALLVAFVARFLPGLHCYIHVVLQELSIFRQKMQGSISGNMLPISYGGVECSHDKEFNPPSFTAYSTTARHPFQIHAPHLVWCPLVSRVPAPPVCSSSDSVHHLSLCLAHAAVFVVVLIDVNQSVALAYQIANA